MSVTGNKNLRFFDGTRGGPSSTPNGVVRGAISITSVLSLSSTSDVVRQTGRGTHMKTGNLTGNTFLYLSCHNVRHVIGCDV